MDPNARPNSIPLHPQDAAPNSTLKYSSASLHPVQRIVEQSIQTERAARLKMKSAAFGSAMPMREMMLQHQLSQCQRLPGLPSSYAGLESLTGRDETIDFEDFINLPQESPDLPQVQQRDQLERVLNIPNASTLK